MAGEIVHIVERQVNDESRSERLCSLETFFRLGLDTRVLDDQIALTWVSLKSTRWSGLIRFAIGAQLDAGVLGNGRFARKERFLLAGGHRVMSAVDAFLLALLADAHAIGVWKHPRNVDRKWRRMPGRNTTREFSTA
jgi:hypothetical protein